MTSLWNVHLEGRGELTETQIDAILEELGKKYSPAVSGGPGFPTFGLTVTISAATAPASAARAIDALSRVRPTRLGDIRTIEVQPQTKLEASLDRPTYPELAGAAEVATLLEISRQRLHEIVKREDFPAPLATLRSGPVWMAPMIRAFADRWARKSGRPRKRIEKSVATG